MPKEDRRITFSNEEVYRAIYALSAQKQVRKPDPGQITSVSEDEGDKKQILFKLENPAESKSQDLIYSRDFLAAALMLFCRGLGIPIPKSAKKSVLVVEGKAMLRIQKSD